MDSIPRSLLRLFALLEMHYDDLPETIKKELQVLIKEFNHGTQETK